MTSLSSIHDRICIRHGGEECRNHLDTYLSNSIQAGYISTIEDSSEDSIWDRDTIGVTNQNSGYEGYSTIETRSS